MIRPLKSEKKIETIYVLDGPLYLLVGKNLKKMKTIKDKSVSIKVQKPNFFQLQKLVKRIMKCENIQLNDELIIKYIDYTLNQILKIIVFNKN